MNMHDFSLETERLRIRSFQPSDGSALAEILTDPEVVYFEPYEPFSYDAALQEAVHFSESDEFYAVALKETDRVIGKIYFHNCARNGIWEIGWTFHKAYQGKGLAYEGVNAFLQAVFRSMPIRKVIAEINGRNVKSQNLAKRLGMQQEACLRQDMSQDKNVDGSPIWDDRLIYGLFSDELK